MSSLLSIAIGPVQEFIAAARRTADLQAGSDLLVETAQKVAKAVEEAGGDLIFPANAEADGPNKILARIEGDDPADVAAAAEMAARKHLLVEWNHTVEILTPGMKNCLDQALAMNQINRFLEFYAAWVPLEADYPQARIAVERLLAGRKALRDFEQPESRVFRPKSPLDPSRDGVFHNAKERSFATPTPCRNFPLWLKTRETLDAISTLKRVKGGESREAPTPTTSRMAALTILPEIELKADKELSHLEALAEKAGASVDVCDLLFPGRVEEAELMDRGFTPEEIRYVEALRRDILKAIGRSECPPYYAILAADGDRMGKLLNQMRDAEAHKRFSDTVSEFAAWAKICVKRHSGHPVYTGGDDVLALLPVNSVLDCAAELATEFRRRITELMISLELQAEGGGTLSVGVAIVHHMDPLQISLERAREAERTAKKTRDSLAVGLHTRGGSPLMVSARWSDAPAERWISLITALQGDDLARGFPYELLGLAREWRATDIPKDRLARRLQEEALRILQRKKGGKGEDKTPDTSVIMNALRQITSPQEMEEFADQLVIARFLATYRIGGEEAHD